MTPQEAGQRIRALADDAEIQLHEPGGTPTRRTFETATEAVRIISDFVSEQLPELAQRISDVEPQLMEIARTGRLKTVIFLHATENIAIDVLEELANLVEQQLALNAPSPPIVAIPDTLEVVQERTAIALLNRLAKAAEDGAEEYELHQISKAYRNVTKEGVENSSDRPDAAQLGALLMRAEGLRAAQDVLQKAGLDIRQHPANVVQILVDQRDEARATAKTLENELVTARKISAEIGAERDSRVAEANATISTLENELVKTKEAASNRESTAAVHVYLDTLRIPDGKLRDRLQCLEAVRNRLDNVGFNADDISLAVRDALAVASAAKLHADDAHGLRAERAAVRDEFAKKGYTPHDTDQAVRSVFAVLDKETAKYEGVRSMLDEIGKRLFERFFDGHIGHKEWPKTHVDDFAHADTFQAVPGDVRALFAATLTLVRHLANSEKIENTNSTWAKSRNDVVMTHQYLDTQHIQDGTILERVQVLGIIRDLFAKDGFNSDNLPSLIETVLESLRDAQKARDVAEKQLDEIGDRLTSKGFLGSPLKATETLLGSMQEARHERDVAIAEVARLKGLALVNDVTDMHESLNDAGVPDGHIVTRVQKAVAMTKKLYAELGGLKMLQEAIAEAHQVLDEAKMPNGNLVKRVRAVAVMATNLRAELDAANEQTSLQSRTIRNLAELLDANVTSKNLVALVKGLRELGEMWRRGVTPWQDAAVGIEKTVRAALGERYDAVIAAAKAHDSKPIGMVVTSGSNGDLVPVVFAPPAKRTPSEF